MDRLRDAAKSFFIPALVTVVMHFRYGYVQPLVLQIIFPWRQYLSMPLVKVHVFGNKPEGDLKRPWKGGFDQMWVEKGSGRSRPTPILTPLDAPRFQVSQPKAMTEKEYERVLKSKSKKAK